MCLQLCKLLSAALPLRHPHTLAPHHLICVTPSCCCCCCCWRRQVRLSETCVCLLSAVFKTQLSRCGTGTAGRRSRSSLFRCLRSHAPSAERGHCNLFLWDSRKVEHMRHKREILKPIWHLKIMLRNPFLFVSVGTSLILSSTDSKRPGQMWQFAAFLALFKLNIWGFGLFLRHNKTFVVNLNPGEDKEKKLPFKLKQCLLVTPH